MPRKTLTRVSVSICKAALVRRPVAPAPAGSSTSGLPRVFACFPALSIAATRAGLRVPILSVTAPASAAISSTSSAASAMAGDAPLARRTLATKLAATKLVILWTKGLLSRSTLSASAVFAANFVIAYCYNFQNRVHELPAALSRQPSIASIKRSGRMRGRAALPTAVSLKYDRSVHIP